MVMNAMSEPNLTGDRSDFFEIGSNASVVSPNETLKHCPPWYVIIIMRALYQHATQKLPLRMLAKPLCSYNIERGAALCAGRLGTRPARPETCGHSWPGSPTASDASGPAFPVCSLHASMRSLPFFDDPPMACAWAFLMVLAQLLILSNKSPIVCPANNANGGVVVEKHHQAQYIARSDD